MLGIFYAVQISRISENIHHVQDQRPSIKYAQMGRGFILIVNAHGLSISNWKRNFVLFYLLNFEFSFILTEIILSWITIKIIIEIIEIIRIVSKPWLGLVALANELMQSMRAVLENFTKNGSFRKQLRRSTFLVKLWTRNPKLHN